MDQEIRNKLRGVVTQCRRLLEDDVRQVLEGRYAIFARKEKVTADPEAPVTHLSEEERASRKDILDHFAHIQARGFKPKEALDQLVREIAFTHLNRLCAYKMMEAREVYVGGQKFREAVSRGVNSNGVKFYLAEHPEEERLYNTGQQDIAFRHYLDWLGGLLSGEIGVLFNPNDPANRLYPRQKTLDEVLDLLNGGGIKPEETELREQWPQIWSQDETIGWVYQYFTPKELRDKARTGNKPPANSYELAFRNQFFTPRYVVEFLTDNTLGRIWYEMRQGDTPLKDQCRYMVRRPSEVFLRDPTRPLATMPESEWVIAAANGDFSQLPEDPTEQDLSDFSLIHDGYELAERLGRGDCINWADEVLSRYREGNELPTNSIDLWLLLFRKQRYWGRASHVSKEDIDEWKQIYLATRAALQRRGESDSQEELLRQPVFIPYRAKKDPRELKILDPACGSGHFLLYCFDLLLTIYEEAYADADLGPALKQDYPTLDALKRDVPRLILGHNLHGIDIDLRASQIAALALWLRCQRAYQDMGFKKDRPQITRSNFVCAEPMPGEEQMLKEFVGQLEPKVLGQVVEVVFAKMKLAGEAGSLLKIEEEIRDAVAAAKKQYIRETTQATDRKGQPLLFTQATMDRLAGKPEQPSLFDLSDITDDIFFEKAEARVIEVLRSFAEKAQHGQKLQRRLFTEDAVRGFAFVDLCQKRYDVVLMNPPFGEASVPSRSYLYSAVSSSTQDLCAAFVERWAMMLSVGGLLGALTSRLVFFKDLLSSWRESILVGAQMRLRDAADLGYGVLDEAIVEAAAYIVGKCDKHSSTHGSVTFVSALTSRSKASHLLGAIASVANATTSDSVFSHMLSAFSAVPGKMFPYWCSRHWLDRFTTNPDAHSKGVIAKKGLETGDDFRQLRLLWETPLKESQSLVSWTPYSKGGEYCPFQMDIHMAFDWRRLDEARRRSNSELYGNRGLTYTQRTTSNFATRVLPAGSLFSPGGPGIFIDGDEELWGLLGFTNSSIAVFYAELLVGGGDSSEAGTAARNFPPTLVETMPVPESFRDMLREIAPFARTVYEAMELFHGDETSPRFIHPFMRFQSFREGATSHYDAFESAVVACCQSYLRIDTIVARHYRLHNDELRDLYSQLGRPLLSEGDPHEAAIADEQVVPFIEGDWEASSMANEGVLPRALTKLGHKVSIGHERAAFALNVSPSTVAKARKRTGCIPEQFHRRLVTDTLSYVLGVSFGRWDITKASHANDSHVESCFGELRVPTPGMLDAPGSAAASTGKSGAYPISIRWNGVLVDDQSHSDDIRQAVRDVIEHVWQERADDIEKEACDCMRVNELRDYFRKPGKGGFWDEHISRYSKSRRKAPIYWLLQSSKKNYALWLYYHRLDKDLLFKALVNYVEPKIRLETSRLEALRSQKAAAGESGKEAKRLAKEVEKQEEFLSELQDFEDKLRRAANLHLEPDLNDGVVLNIAPLWELVPWKEAKKYWTELMAGKYEWSTIGKQLREKGLVK